MAVAQPFHSFGGTKVHRREKDILRLRAGNLSFPCSDDVG